MQYTDKYVKHYNKDRDTDTELLTWCGKAA